MHHIAVFGSTSAIGRALIEQFVTRFTDITIHAISRSEADFSDIKTDANVITHQLDLQDEAQLDALAKKAAKLGTLDCVVIATGVLHTDEFMPEKSMLNLMKENLTYVYEVNTIMPLLISKYFLPIMNKKSRSIFAILSDRVGSISDNNMGGWYAYRMSKSALNMAVKCFAIEVGRSNPNAIVIGLHPGTVDSFLSKPFQKYVKEKILTPTESADKTINVLTSLSSKASGNCYSLNGDIVEP